MNEVDLTKFKYLIGDLILNCQCIERDLKLIYGIIQTDSFNEAIDLFSDIQESKKTMGYITNCLIDSAFFNEDDCQVLRKLTRIRNYWCHQGFIDFIYDVDDLENFKQFLERLKKDVIRVENLQQAIEKYRLSIF